MEERIIEIIKSFNEELVEDLNQDLLATEMLDSFDVVKLVMTFEDEFDIEIDEELVTPENFQTVNLIVAMVKNILADKN